MQSFIQNQAGAKNALKTFLIFKIRSSEFIKLQSFIQNKKLD